MPRLEDLFENAEFISYSVRLRIDNAVEITFTSLPGQNGTSVSCSFDVSIWELIMNVSPLLHLRVRKYRRC